MEFIAAGLFASITAFFLNRYVFAPAGRVGVVFLSPLFEEVLKTGYALILGASIVLSHAFFGALEAVLDLKVAKKGKAAAGISFISHLVLGILTYYVYVMSSSLHIAIAAAALIHFLWNKIVYDIVISKLRK